LVANSVHIKLSILLFLVLSVSSISQVTLFAEFAKKVRTGTDQALYRDLAEEIAEAISPSLNKNFSSQSAVRIARKLSSHVRNAQVYLLDSRGRVVLDFQSDKYSNPKPVRLKPIDDFLSNRPLPIYGSNPRYSRANEVFSVAEINYEDKPAYLYVVFDSAIYRKGASGVVNSYILRNTLFQALLSVLVASSLGWLMFSFTTKRLSRITDSVEQFREGVFEQAIPVTSGDELGRLANSFNEMAEKLSQNIGALEETDYQRRQLVANISHDLRGPLTSLYGYSETLLLSGFSEKNKKTREICETIFRNVELLKRLVEELFELSKLDAQDKVPKLARFDVAGFLDDLYLKFELIAKEAGIKLSKKVTLADLYAQGDIALLERALSNLIENAIRHTPAGARVELIGSRAGEFVIFEVNDGGRGIAESEIPFIFERFFHKNRAELDKSEGSGLGLAIAKKIIDLHSSVIRVESEENIGTKFSFRLKAD
jgi:signal transduction histidine kinase